ncbi:MAG: phosphate acyltransferase PlsX [Deltaproteobacteria bacterium]
MKIIVDAMGGDNAPEKIIKGCISALEVIESEIILVGKGNVVEEYLKKFGYKDNRISVYNAEEVVENEDVPTKAIKTKKNSSMVIGLNLLKEGKGDAFLSAGNTGALMAGALLIVGRMKGVDRPALAPIIPTYNGKALIVDGGSNSNCKPENLLQFAIMGNIYMQTTFGVENPRVGLVNIGTEEIKGNELTKNTYYLLKESGLNFIGNIEGRDIPLGSVDIAVCDGFVGNVILKVIEGMGKIFGKMIKEEVSTNLISKLGGLCLFKSFKRLKKRMDYTEYGGALYLGLEKPVIKCHGTSKEAEIKYSIIQAETFVKNKTVEKIRENLNFMEEKSIQAD